MNTYQITAICCRGRHDTRETVEMIDAVSLEEARKKFLSVYPNKTTVIIREELIHTDILEREATASAGDRRSRPEPPQVDQREEIRQMKLRAMRLAISITFEHALKSDLYLRAAQRGQDDFYFLLDSNIPLFANSVLGMYQRIFDEVINVDPSLQ